MMNDELEFGIHKLSLVSYLAPNMFGFYQAVGAYLGRVLGIETQIVQSHFDPLHDPVMQQDQLDIAFICGLPFVQLQQISFGQLQPLVAPVMQASRYQDCPVYFADVIVKAESRLKTFNDLAGKIFCYNDLGSNSGYNMVQQRLLQAGLSWSFFAQVQQSGSHQHSIKLVMAGMADCAAIDSTVLEQELRNAPEIAEQLRIVESIGPCPIPPVVASRRLGTELISLMQSALCQPDLELQLAMQQAQIKRYVTVQLEDYQAIAAGYEIG